MIANLKQWEGQLVNGEFPLQRSLGESEHSAVFLVETSAGGGAQTAIRFIAENSEDARGQLPRWEAASRLNHPNLIRIFKTGRCEMDGGHFLYALTEYAEEDLSQILPQRVLTAEETRQVLEAVVGALTYLHGKGLVHGSLKPSNVLAVGDSVKISSDTLRPSGECLGGRMGKSAYDAPEVADGKCEPPADVWSLGVTVVEALTQRLPASDAAQGRPPVLPAGIPQPFREIVENCLQVDPAKRWTVTQIGSRLRDGQRETARTGPVAVPSPAARQLSAVPRDAARSALPEERRSAKWPYVLALAVAALLVVFLIARTKPSTSPSPAQTAQPDTSTSSPNSAGGTSAPPHASSAPAQAAAEGPIIERVMPDISPGALRSVRGRIQIRVRLSVDETGRVTQARLRSSGPSRYFARQALEAARGWKFRPALANGQPVPSQWMVQFMLTRRGIDDSAERVKP